MNRLRHVRLTRIHSRHLTSFPQYEVSPLSQSNLQEEKPSPQKNPNFQILLSNFSVFSASPVKARSDSEVKTSRLVRTKTRVESLDNLMKKCNDFNEEVKSTRHISLYNKQAGQSIRRIRKSLNMSHEASAEINSKNLRKDAQVLNDHLKIATKNLKTGKSVWKFSSRNISKKTEKLMEMVNQQLTSRKKLRKVFHYV
jgi:hypothetical protein